MASFITFGILACVAISGATEFEGCYGNGAKEVKSVEISGCPEILDSCLLEGNPNKTVVIEFKTNYPAQTVTVVKFDSYFSRRFDVSWDANTDACVDSGLTCPLTAGQSYTYTTSFVMNYQLHPKDYEHLRFQWKLWNEEKYTVLCVQVPNKFKVQ